MSIEHVTVDDLQKWANGINGKLTKSKAMLDSTKSKVGNRRVFENGKFTCLLFPFSECGGYVCPRKNEL